VYLMLPRETLAAPCPPQELTAFPVAQHTPVKAAGIQPQAIEKIAAKLIAGENPLLVTAYAGRNPRTPALIEELASLTGMRVCEFNPAHLNIRRDSPCFAGYLPGPFVEQADVGLMVDIDVPWLPSATRVNADAWWAQIDIDAVKRDIPMWGFAAEVRVEGDSELLLAELVRAVRALATPDFERRVAERMARLRDEQAKRQAAIEVAALTSGSPGAINPAHVCAALHRALAEHDVVLNEAIRNAMIVFDQIPRNVPCTLFGSPGGGLGYSAGMALGLKLADPARRVVHIVGDGTFYLSNPSAVFAVAQQYGLPILTVVLDNSGWSAVKESTLRMYPRGHAKATGEFASRLPAEMNFGLIAEAGGAHGEYLSDPADTQVAVERCIGALDQGRSALLHVRIAKH
jgi:acetolactate synthase-1/2/3 large subunit